MDLFERMMTLLDAVAGSLSLLLIVLLAIALVSLTVVYVASALWVLERFARASQRVLPVLGASAIVSAIVCAAGLRTLRPELDLAPWGAWLGEFVKGWPAMTVLSFLLALPLRALVRRVSPGTLAVASTVLIGAGLALVLASAGNPLAPAAPLALFAFATALTAWRNQRRGYGSRPLMRSLQVLTVVFALAVAASIALSEANPQVAYAGGSLAGLWLLFVVFALVPLAGAGLFDLRGSAEWFLASRYLVARRRELLISVITGVCIAGVAAGVWLIITVLSVLNGVEQTWREQIVANHAHFIVRSATGAIEDYEAVLDAIRATDGVVAATATLEAEGMIRGGGQVSGLRVRGLDPASAAEVTRVGDTIVEGSLADLAAPVDEDNPRDPILLGSVLAEKLGVSIGDEVLVISPHGGARTPLGPSPRLLRYRVVGSFRSHFLQYDELYAYTSLAGAQRFLRFPNVAGSIEVRSTDLFRSQPVARAVEAALGSPYYARDWKQLFPHLFRAVQDNRSLLMMLMVMIMAVGAFTIVATLLLMILEKAGDIGILKAMGAETVAVERIFAIEGALIGFAGVFAGVVAGVAVTDQLGWIQQRVEAITGIDTLPESVYQLASLPAEIDPLQVLAVAGVALCLALGATLIPARQGARIDPVAALRRE